MCGSEERPGSRRQDLRELPENGDCPWVCFSIRRVGKAIRRERLQEGERLFLSMRGTLMEQKITQAWSRPEFEILSLGFEVTMYFGEDREERKSQPLP